MSGPELQSTGAMPLFASMVRTRLELAALDVESHVTATVSAFVMAVVALVFSLIAFTFAGIAVIALYWDSHRVIATLATTSAYFIFAGVLVFRAAASWKARPAAFAATLHELERDRAALRGGIR